MSVIEEPTVVSEPSSNMPAMEEPTVVSEPTEKTKKAMLRGYPQKLMTIKASDGKFNEHVRTKLVKANKCLHVLRTLRKEHYSQAEIDHLFISIVLPNFSYALSVYGASESDLTVIQNFLDRCHKRRFISFPVFI